MGWRMRGMALGMGLALVGVRCGWGQPQTVEQMSEQRAEAANATWLRIVDAGGYGRSWDEAAAYFKAGVTEAAWQRAMAAAREPLGEVVSRVLQHEAYETRLPGAPDGEYVVALYATQFAQRRAVVETVVTTKGADGVWRVCGYFVK